MSDTIAAPNRLRELRDEARLSQAALGALVGVSKQAISDFELGDKAPSLGVAASIARVLSDALGRQETVDGVFLAGGSRAEVDETAPEAAAAATGGPTGTQTGEPPADRTPGEPARGNGAGEAR